MSPQVNPKSLNPVNPKPTVPGKSPRNAAQGRQEALAEEGGSYDHSPAGAYPGR